jgi:hypothetical protein
VTRHPWDERLYLANAAVLLVHQMDAVHWQEWHLFGLAGGLPLFLALNLPLVGLVVAGYGALSTRRRSGQAFAWALAGSGAFAVVFHAHHLLAGDARFRASASLALLTATAFLSSAQALRLARARAGDAAA